MGSAAAMRSAVQYLRISSWVWLVELTDNLVHDASWSGCGSEGSEPGAFGLGVARGVGAHRGAASIVVPGFFLGLDQTSGTKTRPIAPGGQILES
jgi:hypothetical protein